MSSHNSIARIAAGEKSPVSIIAEISCNHGGRLEDAEALIEAACSAGADAIKFQTYSVEDMVYVPPAGRVDAGNDRIEGSAWAGQSLADLYRRAATPIEWMERLRERVHAHKRDFIVSPFSVETVEILNAIGVDAWKIASFEIVDLELIEAAARTGRPVIISTGMAILPEIREAVSVVRQFKTPLIILHCISSYPARSIEMRLGNITALRREFGCPVGLSDHSMSVVPVVGAVALGAAVIEKHICLSRSIETPDSGFSLDVLEFEAMARAARQAEESLDCNFGPLGKEKESLQFRRGLWAVEDIEAGESFTRNNIRALRPAGGLSPCHLPEIIGETGSVDFEAAERIPAGSPLGWDKIKMRIP